MDDKLSAETQKFANDVAWVAASQVLLAISGLIIIPILTEYYSSELYGVWVQIVVTVGFLSPVLTLQFGTSIVRFLAAEDNKEELCRAFGTMLWSILVFIILVLFLSILLRYNLSILLFANPTYADFIPLVVLWASADALFAFSLSYLRAKGKMKRLSVVQMGSSILKIGLILTLVMAEYSLVWVIGGIVLGEAIFAAIVFGMITKEIGLPKRGFVGLRGYLAFSAPQVPSGALIWVIDSSDKYLITHHLSISQTGIYSVSYALGSVVALFVAPISFVLLPKVSKLWEQKELIMVKNYFKYSTNLLLTFTIPGAVGLYLLSQPLLRILTTSEYMAGGVLVLLIAVGMIFLGLYTLNVYIIYLVKQTKWLPIIIGIAALLNAGINVFLLSKMGIIAAAVSTLVSYFMLATIVIIWAMKSIGYKFDFKFLSKVVGATIFMAFCLNFIEIDSSLGIVLAVVVGAVAFSLGLFLLRAFSREEKILIKKSFLTLNIRLK